MFWNKYKNFVRKDIEPDEIFMDSANLPGFERGLFEGRIEAPLSNRVPYSVFAVFLFVAFAALALLIRLQVINHDAYLARAENNTLTRVRLSAERGLIYDRNMNELAWNSSDGRAYWKDSGLAHILGYLGYPDKILAGIDPKSRVGRGGIEAVYEELLRGKDGSRLIEESADGDILSQSVELEPVNGKSVVLTIDAEMQSKFFSIVEEVVKTRGFRAGAGAVIDVQTGEILAAVSFPEFSSEVLSQSSSEEEIISYLKSGSQPFFFRAFEGLYAPGSIFKTVVALAALSEKIIDPAKQIFSAGSISIPNPYFPDQSSTFYDWKAHGWVDMRRALAVSSNIYFYTVGGGFGNQNGLGVKKITDYALRMGLGKKVGVELAESEGFLPSPEWKEKNDPLDPVWRIGDTYNLSIGQGMVQVTPLQMASVVATISRGGVSSDIHLVKGTMLRDKFDPINLQPDKKADIPDDAFEIVKEGMKQAAEYGTASALSGLGVKVGGKTGTAEIGSEKKKVNSWLLGFMPYDNPRMAVSIVLEAGNSQNLVGATYAARELILWLVENRPEYLR
ncbi:MAG: hypothetical protein HYY55_00265 [Candidatus Niyogibacteria bacterium]|nr:MAG: hypothetical protein HYY55_00265 [Candidatus Niyogibacteria bacterium]